jgi:hypothetical protein
MQVHRARPFAASMLALFMLVFMLDTAKGESFLLLSGGLPLAAAGLFHGRKLQLQLMARAAIWAAMILDMVLAHIGWHMGAASGAVVTGALALLVAGPVASAEPGAFQPVAYQRTLTLSLVLGLADTFTLWMWTGFAMLGNAPVIDTLGFLACAVVTLVSVIGLYRLRMWGLALSVVGNAGIVIVFGLDLIRLPELKIIFITPAIAQLVVALPVLAGVILRRPLEPPAWVLRASRMLVPTALVMMIALAIQPLFGRPVLRQIAEWLLR